MLKPMWRKRVFGAGLAAVLLFVVYALVRSFVLPRPVSIGGFIMPSLPGWEQKVSRRRHSSEVAYRKEVQGNKLFVSLTWHMDESSNQPPRTAQDLQKAEQKGRQATAPMLARFKITVESLVNQPTSLNGMPALLLEDIIRSRQFSRSKKVPFINGHMSYSLSANVSAPSESAISPQAQAELDEAWTTIATALKP